ncbi:M42 family metallopeptidase [candidate division WOR-3 bacterium]|nr:M42 family metallopeptidase [candidate division WOR-3 bacterium]
MRNIAEKFTQVYGPSGNENKIRKTIESEIKSFVDEIHTDNLGNLIARKKGPGKKILFAAHMDEIGVIVNYADEKGFLRFAPLGGVYPMIAAGQRVVFEDGTQGVVGCESRDITPGTIPPLSKMYIDIGAKDRKEALAKIRIGDKAGFSNGFSVNGQRWISKAMDDRIGCAVIADAIKKIKKPVNDLYFVFTVQEEVGLRGAKTSAYAIDPALAVAVDVTGTGDTPKGFTMSVEMGKGPGLKIMDASIVVTEKMKSYMRETAEKRDIPYQNEILVFGGTDAGAFSMTRSGIHSGCISVPSRYIHSPSEMVDSSDVENASKWIVSMCETDAAAAGF